MCLIKGRITDFHDKIIDVCCAATRVTSLMGANCGLKLFQVGTQEWILPEILLYFGTTSGRNVKNLTRNPNIMKINKNAYYYQL